MSTLASKITVPTGVAFRDVAGEAVLLNMDTGIYYGLDETGTRMWTLLSEHGRVEPAYRALLEEYEVSEEQLQQDLLRLVDELASAGLLQIDEADEA